MVSAPIRPACLAIGLLLAATLAERPAAQPVIPVGPKPIEVRSRALPSFLVGAPDRTIFGGLEWLGGLELISANRHFGALSGVTVSDDGSELVAVTDNGFWVRGRVTEDAGGAPTALTDVQIAPMLDRSGRVLNFKGESDAESIGRAVRAGKPVYLVAFERDHRIEIYDQAPADFTSRPVLLRTPKAIRGLRANKGIESLAVGRPGTASAGLIVIIAERSRRHGGDVPGWLMRPNGKFHAFHVRRLDDFDVTDAAFLPDGDLLLLERRFNFRDGIFMRLRRIAAGGLRAGRIVDGPVLMTADFTHQIDNMEGLAVHRSKTGDVILTLVSDDNRSVLQRTLLLRFRLRAPELEITPLPRPRASTR